MNISVTRGKELSPMVDIIYVILCGEDFVGMLGKERKEEIKR
jgi:hypothetical protein